MESKNRRSADHFTTVLLVVYLMILVWVLLFKLGVQFSYMSERRVNLNPVNDIFTGKADVLEAVLNILIFIPLGVYLGVLYRKHSFVKMLIIILSITLIVESTQYLLKTGAFDTTDLLTNTLGGLIGLIFFQCIASLFSDSLKTQRIVNLIAFIGTLALILLLILLKMNRLPIMYK